MPYHIILHDYTFSGTKQPHKKSGLYYWRFLCSWEQQDQGIGQPWYSPAIQPVPMEFKSAYEAKCFLLLHSSFPKFMKYMISIPDEKVLDKLIAKGNYTLNGRSINNLPQELCQGNLLCEYCIVEVKV